jgi:tetratricopeptide (TPR) repeat protein
MISSNANLQAERNAVEDSLSVLEIEGSRFETWPATPNPPLEECIKQIEESDAVILILGKEYGKITKYNISATHLEFKKACDIHKPIFVFILDEKSHELEQEKFINDVQESRYRGSIIKDIDDLKKQVYRSLLYEFTRCFREVHSPPKSPPFESYLLETEENPALPHNQSDALTLLEKLYEGGQDSIIHNLAPQVESYFSGNHSLFVYIYMSEINLGMNGGKIDETRLRRAIEFWNSKYALENIVPYSRMYNLGNTYSALQEHEQAIESFKTCLSNKPDFAECWKNYGTSLVHIGDIATARDCFKKALQYNPQLIEALYSMGTISITKDNNPDLALSYFNRIINSAARSNIFSAAQSWKAYIFLNLKHYAEGIAHAEDAIHKSPEAKWAWEICGRLYSLARREDETWLHPSLNFWRRYVEKYPKNSEAWAELGFICWSLREEENIKHYSDEASKAFKIALELDYKDDGLLNDRIGHLHQSNNDWINAKAYFEKAAQSNPEKFGYCYGICLMSLQQYQSSLPWLSEAAIKYQPDAQSWYNVAVCNDKLRKLIDAESAFKKAIELEPDNPKYLFDLGGFYWNQNNVEQTKIIWTEAVEKYPDYELAQKASKFLRSIE